MCHSSVLKPNTLFDYVNGVKPIRWKKNSIDSISERISNRTKKDVYNFVIATFITMSFMAYLSNNSNVLRLNLFINMENIPAKSHAYSVKSSTIIGSARNKKMNGVHNSFK